MASQNPLRNPKGFAEPSFSDPKGRKEIPPKKNRPFPERERGGLYDRQRGKEEERDPF
jgi:hypothetical protein